MRTIEAQTPPVPPTTQQQTNHVLDPQSATAALNPTPAQTRTAPATLEELRDSIKAEIDYSDAVSLLGQKGLQATVDKDGEKVTLTNVLAYDKLKSLHISGVDLTLDSSPKLVNKNGDVVGFGEFILEHKGDKKLLKEVLAGTVFDDNTKFCADAKAEKEVRKILKKIAKPYEGDGNGLHNLTGFGAYSPTDRQGLDGPDWDLQEQAELAGTYQIGADDEEASAAVPAPGVDDLIVSQKGTATTPDEGNGNQAATNPDPTKQNGTKTTDELEALAAAEEATRQADARQKAEEDRMNRKKAFFDLIDSATANDKVGIEANLKTVYEADGKTPVFGADSDTVTLGVRAIVAETSKLSPRDRLKVVDHLIGLRDDPDATPGQQRMAKYIGAQIADWQANNQLTFTGIADVFQEPTIQPIVQATQSLAATSTTPITVMPVIAPLPTALGSQPATVPEGPPTATVPPTGTTTLPVIQTAELVNRIPE